MRKTIQHIKRTIFSVILSLLAISAAAQDTKVSIQEGHSGRINSVTFSPDGRYVLTGSEDKTAKLWEVTTGREIRTFIGHSGWDAWGSISSVAFSPDGRYILTGSSDKTMKLWEVATGQEVHTFTRDKSQNEDPSIFGQYSDDQPQPIKSVKFSPDGRYAISHDSEGAVTLWEVATGREIRTFSETATAVTFSPNGRHLLMGNYRGTLKLWDVEKDQEVRSFSDRRRHRHKEEITSLAYSPDGRYVLSGSWDKTAKLWDVSTGKEIQTFTGHEGWVTSVAFSPDGRHIVTGSWDETAKLWNVSTGREVYTFEHDEAIIAHVNSVAFSPDGRYVLTGSWDKTAKLWDISTGREVRTFLGHSHWIANSVAYSPDGRNALSGGVDNILRLWDLSSGRQIRSFTGHTEPINSVTFSPDGRYALSGSRDKTAKLWEVSTGREIRTFTGHGSFVNRVAFSPNGLYVLTGSHDKTAKLWEVSTGRELYTFYGGQGQYSTIASVSFSPDGRYVLIGTADTNENILRLWEVSTGRDIRTFSGGGSMGVFSPDGRYILSHGIFGGLKLWEVSTGREIRTFKGRGRGAAFSPDGQYVISGSPHANFGGDNNLRLWEVASGREVRTFSGHKLETMSVDFSSDGRRVISSSKDGSIRIWDVNTGKEIAQMVSWGEEWIILTPEGYYNASANGAEYLNVHIGNEVFPIDNFFSTYYRPDLVQAALGGSDVSQLTNSDIRTNVELPPLVRFTSPTSGTTSAGRSVILTAEITDRGGGIGEVRLTHNGKTISSDTRGLKLASGQGETISQKFEVSLLPGENVFELIALSSGQRIESNPARLVVQYEGVVATSDLYVLAVGLNEYKNASLNLNYGRPDAEAFVQAIKKQSADIFKSVNVTALYDAQATRQSVHTAFEGIIAKAQPQDAFLFFYAGHGVMSEPEGQKQGDFYMALHETIQLYGNNDGLKANGISASEMTEMSRRIAARKQLIVLDACQSGGAVQTFAMRGAAEQKAIIQLARSAGLVVMASTGTQQYATEFQALGHGVFTYALLGGLSGKADGGSRDGKITVKELEAFINDRVPALTIKHRGQAQFPNSYARGQDFPISIVIN